MLPRTAALPADCWWPAAVLCTRLADPAWHTGVSCGRLPATCQLAKHGALKKVPTPQQKLVARTCDVAPYANICAGIGKAPGIQLSRALAIMPCKPGQANPHGCPIPHRTLRLNAAMVTQQCDAPPPPTHTWRSASASTAFRFEATRPRQSRQLVMQACTGS